MWKFCRESNGRIVPGDYPSQNLISDAFVAVKRQDANLPGMTVLARMGTAKGMFGKSKGEQIEKYWRFTKADAIALAVFCAQQIAPVYQKYAPDDGRVTHAIEAARSGGDLDAASNDASLAASEARAADEEPASYAAEAARGAVLAAWGADAGKALHAAAWALLYTVQGAYKVDEQMGEEVNGTIEKWLYSWIMNRK